MWYGTKSRDSTVSILLNGFEGFTYECQTQENMIPVQQIQYSIQIAIHTYFRGISQDIKLEFHSWLEKQQRDQELVTIQN